MIDGIPSDGIPSLGDPRTLAAAARYQQLEKQGMPHPQILAMLQQEGGMPPFQQLAEELHRLKQAAGNQVSPPPQGTVRDRILQALGHAPQMPPQTPQMPPQAPPMPPQAPPMPPQAPPMQPPMAEMGRDAGIAQLPAGGLGRHMASGGIVAFTPENEGNEGQLVNGDDDEEVKPNTAEQEAKAARDRDLIRKAVEGNQEVYSGIGRAGKRGLRYLQDQVTGFGTGRVLGNMFLHRPDTARSDHDAWAEYEANTHGLINSPEYKARMEDVRRKAAEHDAAKKDKSLSKKERFAQVAQMFPYAMSSESGRPVIGREPDKETPFGMLPANPTSLFNNQDKITFPNVTQSVSTAPAASPSGSTHQMSPDEFMNSRYGEQPADIAVPPANVSETERKRTSDRGSKVPGGLPMALGTPQEEKLATEEEIYKRLEGAGGTNTGLKEYRDYLQSLTDQMKSNNAEARRMALSKAGFAMAVAASRPQAGSGLSKFLGAASAGGESLTNDLADVRKQQAALQQKIAEDKFKIADAERRDKMDLRRDAVREYNAHLRDAAARRSQEAMIERQIIAGMYAQKRAEAVEDRRAERTANDPRVLASILTAQGHQLNDQIIKLNTALATAGSRERPGIQAEIDRLRTIQNHYFDRGGQLLGLPALTQQPPAEGTGMSLQDYARKQGLL